MGQKRVEADEYHTRSDEDLKPLVQGNTEGHQKEAGGHGPGQSWVPVPQDGGALNTAKETYTSLLDALMVRVGGLFAY